MVDGPLPSSFIYGFSAKLTSRIKCPCCEIFKEVKYHIRFSTSWMERLSLSTDEAHQRVQDGLNNLWRFTAELFELSADEQALVAEGVIPDFQMKRTMEPNHCR